MGMESFRVSMVAGEVMDPIKLVSAVARCFEIEPNRYLRFSWSKLRRIDLALDGEFVIEKYLLLCVYPESMDLQGCFSNYDKNLDLCYELYRVLYGAYPVRVKGLEGDGCFDREAFIAGMKALHRTKYDAFMRRWNIGHVDLFPGDSFYKDMKRRRPGRF